jgi:hypothetical protein
MYGNLVGNTHAIVWFQQVGNTSHIAQMSSEKLCEMSPHHLLSQFCDLNWLPRSPDLSGPDNFFVGLSEEWHVQDVARHFGLSQDQYQRRDS